MFDAKHAMPVKVALSQESLLKLAAVTLRRRWVDGQTRENLAHVLAGVANSRDERFAEGEE